MSQIAIDSPVTKRKERVRRMRLPALAVSRSMPFFGVQALRAVCIRLRATPRINLVHRSPPFYCLNAWRSNCIGKGW